MKHYFSLNLQLFAELNTNVTTAGDLSAEMKTYYDMNLIAEAQPNLIHAQFGQKRDIPKNGGKKIEFRKFASLPKALTPLVEGVTPDGKNLKVENIESEVNQYGDYIVQSDMLELTSIDNTIVEATKVLGNQAGLTLDTIVRNQMHLTTNKWFAPKSNGTAVTEESGLDDTCLLTVDLIRDVVADLKANNAPKIDGSYVAIVHPYVSKDLMASEEWIDAHKYANPENIYEGEIGKMAGVRFVESSEARIYAGGVFGTLIFGNGAYGTTEITGGGLETIIKQKGSAGTADPLDQRSSIGWKATQTAEILIPAYMACVMSKSKASAKAKAN